MIKVEQLRAIRLSHDTLPEAEPERWSRRQPTSEEELERRERLRQTRARSGTDT